MFKRLLIYAGIGILAIALVALGDSYFKRSNAEKICRQVAIDALFINSNYETGDNEIYSKVIDSWGTFLRINICKTSDSDTITVTSAGNDRTFDTGDDISYIVIRTYADPIDLDGKES